MKKILNLITISTLFLVFILTVSAQDSKEKPADSKPKVERETKTKLPTAAEIFRKYVEAIGGKTAAEKIKSRITKGTVELAAMGLNGTFEISAKSPSKTLLTLNLAGFGEILDGFDGTEAWAKNPIQGLRAKTGEELAQTKLASNFYYDFDLEKLYPKAEVTGTGKSGASDVFIVKADPNTTMYFDKQSSQMIQLDRLVSSPEGNIQSQTFFGDFREVDGIRQAFLLRQTAQGMEFIFKVAEIKQNQEINDRIFSKPK